MKGGILYRMKEAGHNGRAQSSTKAYYKREAILRTE